MLFVLLAACSPGETGKALVLTGWEFHWAQLSHRISLLRVGLNQDSTLDLGLVGGDFSTGETMVDTPGYRVRFERVEARGLQAWEGAATFDVGPDGLLSDSLSIDTPGWDGPVAAFLQGFSIDTSVPQPEGYPDDYDPGHGYTSAGFGVLLGEPWQGREAVEVPVELVVRWAPQDREDMNAAIPHAHTEVGVRVLVVGFDGELSTGTATGSAEYEYAPPYTDQPPIEVPVRLEGPGAEGFVGWRGFDLVGRALGEDEGQGDYLRAFGAELVPGEAAESSFEGTAVGALSTTSLIEFTQLAVDFRADLGRVGTRHAWVEHYEVSGTFPTGTATVGPTLDE